MKDRKTRVILILISCVLAVCVLFAARPVLREGILRADEALQLHRMRQRFGDAADEATNDLLPKEQVTALILSDDMYGDYSGLLPQTIRCVISDPDELASLLQTLEKGSAEYTEELSHRDSHYRPSYLALVTKDGGVRILTLQRENPPGEAPTYVLGLRAPSQGYHRLTDQCARVILGLFIRNPERDFSDPATYAAVRVENLATGESVDLDEAQIAEVANALLQADGHTGSLRLDSMPEAEYAFRFRFSDGGEFYLGYADAGSCAVLYIQGQCWEQKYDEQTGIYLPCRMNAYDLFTGEVDSPRRLQIMSYYDHFGSLLQELFGEE